MRRFITTVFMMVFLVGSLWQSSAPALPSGTRVQTYKGSLNFPIDIAWVEGTNKLFFTEKNTGRIRVMVGRRLLTIPCRDLPQFSGGEAGALGITLHPGYENNHWLYVYFTKNSPRENRVVRFKVENNRCVNRRVILKGLPASSGYHNGGQLEFMNGKLFIAVGEDHSPGNAQNTSNRLGKILRVNPDGSIPSGNPFNNKVWSYGHRNPFGLAAHPSKSWLFETENGPSCDDELNRIRKGRNFGWGDSYPCGGGVGPNPVGPLRRWTPPIVPTDLWWYRGRMGKLSGSLYMGDFGNGRLHRFRLNSTGSNVVGHSIVVDMGSGIVDVSKGPGGWLYFATSSAIFRIVPN
jgi:glucose/arabinose dehydrogenase